MACSFVLEACSGEQGKEPAVDKAKPYKIISEEGPTPCCSSSRTKGKVWISSSAPDFVSRAQTALKASMDVERRMGVDYVVVYLLPSPASIYVRNGVYLASAQFARDGRGADGNSPLKHITWEANANAEKLDPTKMKILYLFYERSNDYQTIFLECRDARNLEFGREYWAKRLHISLEEFRHWEQLGQAPKNLQDRINQVFDGSTADDMRVIRNLGCSIGPEDHDRAVFRYIADSLDVPYVDVETFIQNFAVANGNPYDGRTGALHYCLVRCSSSFFNRSRSLCKVRFRKASAPGMTSVAPAWRMVTVAPLPSGAME
jgi:hypothetical protein